MATQPKQPKQVPMCVVAIGFNCLLLPASKGMRVVELLQGAIEVDRRFESRADTYTVNDEVHVEYQSVKASQLRAREATPRDPPAQRGPLLLGGD